MLKSLTFDHLV